MLTNRTIIIAEAGVNHNGDLEQAKQLLYDYVDHVRDVRDIEDITMLHKRLHRLMPNIYPA